MQINHPRNSPPAAPTPAGKEKVSRKFLIPPAWEARIWDVVKPCAATVQDPVERTYLIQYLFLKQWTIELFAYETRLLGQSIARQRSFNRGLRAFTRDNALFLALGSRSHTLNRKAEQARVAWERAKRKRSTKRSILHLIENMAVTSASKTLTMAAGAGSSASITLATVAPTSPHRWAESANRVPALKLIYPLSSPPPP